MMSVYDGTWGSGRVADEIVICDVLLETGWTFAQWDATPRWIQRTMVDTIAFRREAAERQREQSAAANAAPPTRG